MSYTESPFGDQPLFDYGPAYPKYYGTWWVQVPGAGEEFEWAKISKTGIQMGTMACTGHISLA